MAAFFFHITGLDPMKEYSVVYVRTVWDDGTVNQRNPNDTRTYDVKFTPAALLYSDTLADLPFIGPSSRFTWPVTIDGKRYDKSIGMMPEPRREYNINGVFTTLRALVAVDDNITAAQSGQTVTLWSLVTEKSYGEAILSGPRTLLWRSK